MPLAIPLAVTTMSGSTSQFWMDHILPVRPAPAWTSSEWVRAWIDTRVIPGFRDRVIPVDAAVAQRCAALHVPDPRPQRDSLIAATAIVHRLTVVTRNVRDFEPMGVPLLNPWNDG